MFVFRIYENIEPREEELLICWANVVTFFQYENVKIHFKTSDVTMLMEINFK